MNFRIPRSRRRLAHALLLGGAALGFLAASGAAGCSSSSNNTTPIVDAAAEATPVVDAGVDSGPTLLPADQRHLLSETGLYTNIATKQLSPGTEQFRPAYLLWSDAAEKTRWIKLPPGTQIDNSDPDHWDFPVGTQIFKEFALDGKRLETRLIERIAKTGNPEKDYWHGGFAWRDDESDADFVIDGAENVRGTPHDVPAQKVCPACHLGEASHYLGFSAVQLSGGAQGLTLSALAAAGRLKNPPPAEGYAVPGDAQTSAAIGYLHANCGHCHNPNGLAWPDTDMNLRVGVDERTVEQTGVFRTAINGGLKRWSHPGYAYRINAGYPDTSAVIFRASARGDRDQMPPLATEFPDTTSINMLKTWIASLPPNDAGAPQDAGGD